MIEYPKIETLYDRDEKTRKVNVENLRCVEFENIRKWDITEKVDGTNVRVCLSPDNSVFYGGRTDNAQMHVKLLDLLRSTFPAEKLRSAFTTATDVDVVLFGEGYGEKIQSGGSYRKGMSFRLFDVLVGRWWLERDAVTNVATKLGIETVPYLGTIIDLPKSSDDLKQILGRFGLSTVSYLDGGDNQYQAEGIVARTIPMLFTRKGERVMWKLKFRDF